MGEVHRNVLADDATEERIPAPRRWVQPPPKLRCWELMVKEAARRQNVTCISSRMSVLTQPLNAGGEAFGLGQQTNHEQRALLEVVEPTRLSQHLSFAEQ